MSIKSVSLFFKQGGSDKVYHVQVEPKDSLFVVNFQYGRRGAALSAGCKTANPVSLPEAEKIFDKLVREKTGKGYSPGPEGTPFASTDKTDRVSGHLPQLLNPIEEDEVQAHLKSHWYAQEKFDGKRILVRVAGGKADGINRKGLFLGGLPETVVNAARGLPDCVIDGELVGDTLHAFDLLELGASLKGIPYGGRLVNLASLLHRLPPNAGVRLVHTAKTPDEKAKLYARLKREQREGIVFKDPDALHHAGRPASGGPQLKCKFYSTASCVVTRVNAKRSVALGVHDGAKLVAVGNVTIPPNKEIPSPGQVCEIRYLTAVPNGSLYQPVFLGVRDDVDAAACVIGQLKFKAADGDEES